MELLRDSYFRNSYCFRVILEQLLVCSRGSPWVMSDSTAQSTQRTALVFQAQSQDWASCSISFKVKLFFFPIEKLWAFLQEVFCFGFCKNGDRRSRQHTWCPSEVVRSRYGEIKPEADEHGPPVALTWSSEFSCSPEEFFTSVYLLALEEMILWTSVWTLLNKFILLT